MLGTLFLPITITLGVLVYAALVYLPEDSIFYADNGILFGVPFVWWVYAALALPFLLYLWMVWSGNWRRPVLLAGIVTGFFIVVLDIVEPHTPPDKRMIIFHETEGTEVYCNGVLLGQIGHEPLKIRVDELIAKVPEWNTPPEQHWYRDAELDNIYYTWFPWDDFRKERFKASRELFGANQTVGNTARAINARREAINKHNADCRYWWSLQRNKSPLIISRSRYSYHLNRPFEKQSAYEFGDNANAAVPSHRFHVQLLAEVLPELTPEEKAEWDRYILENRQQVGYHVVSAVRNMSAMYHNRDKNDPLFKLYENALLSTARLKYGFSDPPTEDECCRLLADWVAESIREHSEFDFDSNYSSGETFTGLSVPYLGPFTLIPDNIHETMRKALVQQWKQDKFRYERGWAPVAYFSWKDKSPDYFADFARYSATTHQARIALLDNEHPAVLELFKTLLRRRTLGDLMTRQIDLYDRKISTYSQVSNPAVESVMRDYIVAALSDPKHRNSSRESVNRAVFQAIMLRADRKDIDKEELSAWAASLPLSVSSKNLALRRLRIRDDEEVLTFADQLQKAAGQLTLVETELTLDDVAKWFADNPEGDLLKFLEEQEENILVIKDSGNRRRDYWDLFPDNQSESDKFPNIFVRALVRSDTSEGDSQVRDLIRRLWKCNFQIVEQAIEEE